MLALAVSSCDFTATQVQVRDTFIEGFAPRQRPKGTVFLTTHASMEYRRQNAGLCPAISP
jgi:hypothetical protein